MDMHLSNEVILAISTIFGMIGHYAKKKARAETSVSLCQWFGPSNVFGTISSISMAITAVIGVIANNIITPEMSIYSIIYLGLTQGFAIDSATNGDDS
jgi:hypothetical protein